MGRFGNISPAVHSDPHAVDVPITLGRDYGGGWSGEAFVLDEPFIEPGNPIMESYAGPRPISHWVRVDEPPYDDEAWPMNGIRFSFNPHRALAQGQMEPMDDYRLVYDGSHA